VTSSASEGPAALPQQVAAAPDKTIFSEAASVELSRYGTAYLLALEQASRAVADGKGAEMVLASDVQTAAAALGAKRNRKFKRIGEVGALLVGAGLGYVGTVVLTSSYTFKNALVAFIPLLVGTALYILSWARD
jgi:hypothetical protein